MKKNRGTIATSTIAEKLQLAQKEITASNEIADNPNIASLFINGRLNRKDYNYIAKNLVLLESLEKEIKKYCRGVDLTILNYLIFRGLESIKKEHKKEKTFLFIDYSNIEKHKFTE